MRSSSLSARIGVVAAIILLVAVVLIGLSLTAAARIDRSVDQLNLSQAQLESAYRLRLAPSVPGTDLPGLLRHYQDQIAAEDIFASTPAERYHQAIERADLAELRRLTHDPSDSRDLERVTERIVARERTEAAESRADLARLNDLVALGSLIIAAVLIGAAVACTLLLRGGLLRPIRLLIDGVEAVAQGRREHRVETGLPREFSRLASTVNEMADRISDQQSELEASNEQLEARVAERTQSLAVANEQLAEVDRTRRAFFAEISHELRTPVTILAGEAEVALHPAADEAELRDALGRISVNATFLQRELERLLALARGEDLSSPGDRVAVDLHQLCTAVVADVAAFARSRDVMVTTSVAAGVVVIAEAALLRQALLALLDNAIRHSPTGGTVSLDARPAGACLHLVVADDGEGFGDTPPEAMFERYHQGAGREAGAGLGLAIVERIARLHGGAVSAERRPAGGASFSLSLPMTLGEVGT